MGANAATKCYKVVENVQTILAIELMNAAQALEFRRPLKTSPVLESFYNSYRKHVSFVENDKVLFIEIEKSREISASYFFVQDLNFGENKKPRFNLYSISNLVNQL